MAVTREQVVQWMHECGITVLFSVFEKFATLARADLEATIAELKEGRGCSDAIISNLEGRINILCEKLAKKDETIAEQVKEIEQMRLAEEGAKEAFGHVVQQKRDFEAECKRLRILLDGAYKTIRLFPPGAHQDSPTE